MNKYIVIILFIQYALQLSYKNEYKYKKRGCYRSNILFIFAWVVTRMGLEPMTPTLKVLCSTSCASESLNHLLIKRVQSYDNYLIFANYSKIFYLIFVNIIVFGRRRWVV